MKHARSHLVTLVVCIAIAQAAGIVGSLFTSPAIPGWYATLAKPSFNPPSWVFGPVWILLYTLLGIALYLVWTKRIGGRRRTLWLRVFWLQLGLNALWSIIFFGMQQIALAFVEMLILLATIISLIVLGLRLDKRVAALLVPYLAWVSFATFLTWSIWQLNS